jgi:7-carboxy-7-deazaguanine synthase
MSGRADAVPLLEVFSSFQGEGPRVGERQVFVRLSGCDLRCAFCDTPESFPAPAAARVERTPGGEEERPANPVPVGDLLRFVRRLDEPAGLHAAVSITGGEPLLHPGAVRRLAEELGAHLAVHLETGGHRPDLLLRVLDVLDRVTPDLKLRSATGAGCPREAHTETYRMLAASGKALAVKAVVAAETTEGEVADGARLVARALPTVPLVLQPVTPLGQGPRPPLAAALLRLQAAAARHHPDVRVIPQVHRMLGVR